MKVLLLGITLAIPSLLLATDELEIGQTLEETLALLGKPIGTIELRERTLLLYPQGEVTLKDDRVSALDLMSVEEFEADQERLKQEREEWVAQKAMEAEQRIEEGRKIKAFKLQSRAFAVLPAKDRVDYWRSYQIRFPEIDVSEQIAGALEGYEVELTELRAQQRIAELEARVANAEKEAATARLEAQKAQSEAEANKNSRYYGLRYYTDPVIDRRYYYRQPTVTIYTDGKGNTHQHNQHNKVNYYYSNGQKKTEGTAERVTRIINSKLNK
ncbi:MAG: hypothetical protein ACN4GF_08460 [Lentimonas sp.]